MNIMHFMYEFLLPIFHFQHNRLSVLQVDLSNIESMETVASKAVDVFGSIDILINNAGISYRGCIQDTDMDVHMKLMTVNYFGQIALTKGLYLMYELFRWFILWFDIFAVIPDEQFGTSSKSAFLNLCVKTITSITWHYTYWYFH